MRIQKTLHQLAVVLIEIIPFENLFEFILEIFLFSIHESVELSFLGQNFFKFFLLLGFEVESILEILHKSATFLHFFEHKVNFFLRNKVFKSIPLFR
jgi:hypothetical protein